MYGGTLGIHLEQHRVGQRFESPFPSHLRTRAFFLFIRQIQIFQLLQLGCPFNGGAQAFGQLALLFNAAYDLCLAFAEIAQIAEAVFELAELFVFQ